MIEFRLKGVSVEALNMLDENQKRVVVSILVSKAKIEVDEAMYQIANSFSNTICIEDGTIVVPVSYA